MSKHNYDYLIKLMLIGDSGVGKSSLLLKFADDTFDTTGVPTVGIDFKLRTIEINNKKIKLQLLDTAGQERFRTITHAHFRNAMGAILVFDVTSRKSFDNINFWIEYIDKSSVNKIPKIIIGNKIDLNKREVNRNEAEALGYPYFETSAKTGESVDNAFYNLTKTVIEKVKNFNVNIPNSPDNNRVVIHDSKKQQSKCCK